MLFDASFWGFVFSIWGSATLDKSMAPRESSEIRTELLSFSLCSFFLMYSVLPAYFVEEIGNEFWLAMMTFGKDGSDLFGVCLVKIELSSCIDKLDSVLSFVESLRGRAGCMVILVSSSPLGGSLGTWAISLFDDFGRFLWVKFTVPSWQEWHKKKKPGIWKRETLMVSFSLTRFMSSNKLK